MNFRVRNIMKHTKMRIFTYDVIGIGNDGTIYKFVIIRILSYQIKTILRSKFQAIRTIQDKINYILGY